MDPNRYFSVYNLKNTDSKQSLGKLTDVQFGREIFTFSPAAYITVDFKKLEATYFMFVPLW